MSMASSRAKEDLTSTPDQPPGVHSVVSMAPSAPQDDSSWPNQMTTAEGGTVLATSAEDADLQHVEHGAVPTDLEIWPWPGRGGAPAEVDVSEFCATPDVCFPNGIHPSWSGVACPHTGGQTHWLTGRL
jgi:hypothetical protein